MKKIEFGECVFLIGWLIVVFSVFHTTFTKNTNELDIKNATWNECNTAWSNALIQYHSYNSLDHGASGPDVSGGIKDDFFKNK